MATQSYAYDNPQYLVHINGNINLPAVATNVSAGKYVAFAACKVKSIRGVVNVAGTNTAAAATIILKNGTTAFATSTPSTNAAGTALAITMTEQTLAAGGYIDFVLGAGAENLTTAFCLEVEPVPGHTVTV